MYFQSLTLVLFWLMILNETCRPVQAMPSFRGKFDTNAIHAINLKRREMFRQRIREAKLKNLKNDIPNLIKSVLGTAGLQTETPHRHSYTLVARPENYRN